MKTETRSVEVTVGAKKFSRDMTITVVETPEDVLTLLQDPKSASSVVDLYNYANDLKLRAPIRQAILNNEAAQEQAIEKQVKSFMDMRSKAGKPVTEAQARKFVEMSASMDV